MGATNLRFSFSPMHCNKSLLSLFLFNVVGDTSVVEALLPLVCFVVSMLDQGSFSTYPGIIAKLAIPFYISFYSWDLTNLLSCVCRLWNKGQLQALEFFCYLFFPHCVWVFGLQVFVGCRCFSSLNFSVSSIASWCCLSTLSLSLGITLSLSSLLQDVMGVHVPSPLFWRFFSFPSHRFFSFSPLLNLSFLLSHHLFYFSSLSQTFFLSP